MIFDLPIVSLDNYQKHHAAADFRHYTYCKVESKKMKWYTKSLIPAGIAPPDCFASKTIVLLVHIIDGLSKAPYPTHAGGAKFVPRSEAPSVWKR